MGKRARNHLNEGKFFRSVTERSLTGRGERKDREGLQWREGIKSEQLQWRARAFEEREDKEEGDAALN